MIRKALFSILVAALLGAGLAQAQERDPSQVKFPEGPSNGDAIEGGGLPGILCSAAGGTDCAIAIPDGLSLSPPDPGPPAVSTMTLQNCSGVTTDVNVGLDVAHTWVGDLLFTVTAPDSTEVTIVDRVGSPPLIFGCSGDNMFAVLDDAAGAPVEDECALATPTIDGVFSPNNPLSALNGLDANGTWTLTATDNADGFTGQVNDWSLEVTTDGDACEGGGGGGGEPEEPRATIAVQKGFSDDNPMPVDVTLSCNTGLPLEQNYSLDPDRFGDTYVEFVVNDFEDGTMDCEVTEAIPAGYAPEYLAFNDSALTVSPDSCVFEAIEHGETATSTLEEINHVCFIGNTLLESEVVVNKEWLDENPQFNNPYYAEASYSCTNLPDANFFFILPILGGEVALSSADGLVPPAQGNLEFFGNPGQDSFATLGNWDGGTTCTVTEQVVEGGVESDSSDCQSILVFPGEDAECTIVNTRLYEGIPTLSQYGLGLLALLMLGMGFVAVRRFV